MIQSGLIVMGPGVKSLGPLHRAATGCNMPQPTGACCSGVRQGVQPGGYRNGPPVGDAGLKPVLLKMKMRILFEYRNIHASVQYSKGN